jgi:uncharacterized protein
MTGNRLIWTVLLLLALLVGSLSLVQEYVEPLPPGLPAPPTEGPALCQGAFLTPEQGQAMLDFALGECPDRAAWEARAAHHRSCILQALGLEPLPRRTPPALIVRGRSEHDGYSVESVAFAAIPGLYVTGNLYRPLSRPPPYALILSPHGHGDVQNARVSETEQKRCATLARMGALVLAIDMFGYGESMSQIPDHQAHQSPLALTVQTWSSMRALDVLCSLPGADPLRIGVTGESGGGTQSFLLTALDARVAVAVPVVMVSSFFFGGCLCESGLPIHRSSRHFTTNAEICALAAPRPLLVISDGKDWTRLVPEQEYPFLSRIYALYGEVARARVANVHLAGEGHDYGPSKRAAMYPFMAAHLGLDLDAVSRPDGSVDESPVTMLPPEALHVFAPDHPQPADALRDLTAVAAGLKALQ